MACEHHFLLELMQRWCIVVTGDIGVMLEVVATLSVSHTTVGRTLHSQIIHSFGSGKTLYLHSPECFFVLGIIHVDPGLIESY